MREFETLEFCDSLPNTNDYKISMLKKRLAITRECTGRYGGINEPTKMSPLELNNIKEEYRKGYSTSKYRLEHMIKEFAAALKLSRPDLCEEANDNN